jgi:hypothetical protein
MSSKWQEGSPQLMRDILGYLVAQQPHLGMEVVSWNFNGHDTGGPSSLWREQHLGNCAGMRHDRPFQDSLSRSQTLLPKLFQLVSKGLTSNGTLVVDWNCPWEGGWGAPCSPGTGLPSANSGSGRRITRHSPGYLAVPVGTLLVWHSVCFCGERALETCKVLCPNDQFMSCECFT